MMFAIVKSYEVLAAHSDAEPTVAHLAALSKLAAEQAAQGARHVAKQRALIAALVRDGLDTTNAQTLLRTFEEMQVLHVEHRDRLQREEARAARVGRGRDRDKTAPDLHPRRAARNNPR